MGNTFSGDDETEKQSTLYKNYISQQQLQIKKQQQQINQLLHTKKQTENTTKPIKINQVKPTNYHPSNFNSRKPPRSTKTYMNPYKILGIDKNYTVDTLKKAYLKQAVRTHPDKGGNKDDFQKVTIAYTLLLKKLGEKDSDKLHSDLKSGYNDYNANNNLKRNVKLSDNEQFDVRLFNKVYDENKLDSVYDGGYGDWMKKNALGESAEDCPKLFNGNFNKDMFHNVFNEQREKYKRKDIVEYNEPQALNSGGHQLQVLGKGTINDFSSQEVLDSGIKYRDYRDAYENPTLIDINSVNIGERANNIKSYQQQRSNISRTMSREDEIQYNKIQRYKEAQEKERLRNLNRNDRDITNNYERVHKLLIR